MNEAAGGVMNCPAYPMAWQIGHLPESSLAGAFFCGAGCASRLAAMLSGNFPFRKPMEMDADWGAAEWMCVWVR